MEPAFLVLTDLSAAAESALVYTAQLARHVSGRVVLLHVYLDPLLEPEVSMVPTTVMVASSRDILASMVKRAQQLGVPTLTEISDDPLEVALPNMVSRYHPLLVAVGREAPHSALERLVANLALPVLQGARYPLLVVPETWTGTGLPRRLAVAADDQSFWLTAPALALAPLFGALQPRTQVVHVAPGAGPSAAEAGLRAVARTGLFGPLSGNDLFEVREEAPGAGVLHAAAELGAELLVVLARPHTLLGGLFHHSVTAELLQASPIPVLVLPTTDAGSDFQAGNQDNN